MYQMPFERVDHLGIEHALDIHWRIANPQVVSQVLTHDELVERSVTVNVQGHPMRVPSAVDSLLMACVHRVAHHPDVEKPIWVHDIHLLATGVSTRLSGRRSSSGQRTDRCARICLQGLRRARGAVSDRAVPVDVLTALRRTHVEERRRSSCAATCVRSIVLTADLACAGSARRGTSACGSTVSTRRRTCRRTTASDAGRVLPAYYAMRVLNGMAKWLAGLTSRRRDSGSRSRSASRSNTCCARRPRG